MSSVYGYYRMPMELIFDILYTNFVTKSFTQIVALLSRFYLFPFF